jgi:hypothetical protein
MALWETREVCTGFWWGDLRQRGHLKDLDVDGNIILECVFKLWVRAWTDLAEDRNKWRAPVNAVMNFWVP